MIFGDGLLSLLRQSYTVDAIGQKIAAETQFDILATVTSVSRNEWFEGGKNGLKPALVARTAAVNYNGEKRAMWQGVRYTIYRAYQSGDEIDLYLQEETGS